MEARVAEIYGILEMTLGLRGELMTWLTDDSLSFQVPSNPMLGTCVARLVRYNMPTPNR